ncbi:MAG: trigger factor [Mogibacterium sp.]|nr:trigger factor [Mogibacterium sp.]
MVKDCKIKVLALVLMLMMALMSSCGDGLVIPDEYKYDDFSQFIKLGEYKGLEYEDMKAQVSKEELQESIDEMLAESAGSKQVKKGTVKEDSKINIDYCGSIDGVEFDGGSAEGVDVDMADNNFIDGFAEGILGHEAGTTFDIHVTFPENYGAEELAGKDAVFKITVNYIEEESAPEYNDEWVKKNTDFDTVEEFEKSLKEEILNNKSTDSANDQRAELFNRILDDSEVIEYPEKEYNNRYNKIVETYKNYAMSSDTEWADYLSDEMGMTEKEFDDMAEKTAKSAVKQELVLHAIAAAEEIAPSKDDYRSYLDKLLEDAGITADKFKENKGITIEQYAEQNDLYTALLYEKVMDKVMEYSIAK